MCSYVCAITNIQIIHKGEAWFQLLTIETRIRVFCEARLLRSLLLAPESVFAYFLSPSGLRRLAWKENVGNERPFAVTDGSAERPFTEKGTLGYSLNQLEHLTA